MPKQHKTQAIIVVGTITTGFRFVGPFPTPAEAGEHARFSQINEEPWHICNISPPITKL